MIVHALHTHTHSHTRDAHFFNTHRGACNHTHPTWHARTPSCAPLYISISIALYANAQHTHTLTSLRAQSDGPT